MVEFRVLISFVQPGLIRGPAFPFPVYPSYRCDMTILFPLGWPALASLLGLRDAAAAGELDAGTLLALPSAPGAFAG